MAKVSDKVNELKKKLIIESAAKYFQEFGYEKTQIEKISKELSIGVGTIYSYFGSKEGLFYAWIGSIIERAHDELMSIKVEKPIDRLKCFVKYKLEFYKNNKTTLRNYIYNNKISHGNVNPLNRFYSYLASGINETYPEKSEDECYVLAHILDNVINCYIDNYGEKVDGKQEEIVKMYSRILNDEKN